MTPKPSHWEVLLKTSKEVGPINVGATSFSNQDTIKT